MSEFHVIGNGFPGLPISEGIATDHLVFLCGQIGCAPCADGPVSDEAGAQTEQAMNNIAHLLQEAGSDISKVATVQIFLSNASDFAEMNKAYAKFFPKNPPCRTTVEAKIIDTRYLVEITAIAVK